MSTWRRVTRSAVTGVAAVTAASIAASAGQAGSGGPASVGHLHPRLAAAAIRVGCPADPRAGAGALEDAIAAANAAGSGTVRLAAGCTYTLSGVDNAPGYTAPNGLPIITGTLRIEGSGAVIRRSTEAGTPGFRIVEVAAGGDLTLDRITLANGSAVSDSGGAVLVLTGGSLTVTRSVLAGNATARSGGAVSGGTRTAVTIGDSVISGNTAGAAGGAIFSAGTLTVRRSRLTANRAPSGGAVASVLGDLSVTDSVLASNAAEATGGGIDNELGQATVSATTVAGNTADAGGGAYNTGSLRLTNSTVTANQARVGAGVFNHHFRATAVNVTFTDNRVGVAGAGGAVYNEGGSFLVANSILDRNQGGSCNDSLGTPVTDGGHDLAFPPEDLSCPASVLAGDPRMGALGDNGGPTPTMRLEEGSAALDAGDDAVCQAPLAAGGAGGVDQRGETRPQGAHCDIGAVEAEETGGA